MPFEPVPLALSVLRPVHRSSACAGDARRLPDWFLALSVVVDIALLMVTIWSFHLHTSTAGDLPQAPTLMYVFILIALRTLRFEPRFVVLAACSGGGSAGWPWSPTPCWTTGGRARYPQLRRLRHVLRHPARGRVRQVVSIVMVTLILALGPATWPGAPGPGGDEQQAAAGLSRFFAPEIAGPASAARKWRCEPGQAELREAAILFIDLRGFTPLAERLSPAQVMRCCPTIRRGWWGRSTAHGGSIDKFLGDGILGELRRDRAWPRYAADAAAAVEEVVTAALAWAEERRRRRPAASGHRRGAGGGPGDVRHRGRRAAARIHGDRRAGEPRRQAGEARQGGAATAVLPAATFDLARAQGWVAGPGWERRTGRTVAGIPAALDVAVLAS